MAGGGAFATGSAKRAKLLCIARLVVPGRPAAAPELTLDVWEALVDLARPERLTVWVDQTRTAQRASSHLPQARPCGPQHRERRGDFCRSNSESVWTGRAL